MALAFTAALLVGAAAPSAALAGYRLSPYKTARLIWTKSVCDAAAQQPADWRSAATELRKARPLRAGDRHTAAALDVLAGLPITSETRTQQHRFVAETRAIDHFLHARVFLRGQHVHC